MVIERTAPELDRIVSPDQHLEVLGGGFTAAEGPVWYREGGYLLFSDIPADRRMKWEPSAGVSTSQEGTNNANGVTRDPQGRLIICEAGSRRVTRLEPDGSITVVAGSYWGKRLNRPNDVVVKSDGSIYFTDPGGPEPGLYLDFSGVYRVSPDLGDITLLVRNFVFPNGLAFSPDENTMYVSDTLRFPPTGTNRGHIRAFDVQPNGTLALATDRVFCHLTASRRGVADGMKVDVEGNVYCTGPGGVWIIDLTGRHLGTILVGEDKQTTNVGWGDDDWKGLYITLLNELVRIRLKLPGVPVPGLL